ncbi:BamA/TamA family outer membrane protein [candidate division KSB1 bacterium]|nr:BamA/TamA family outer membrane protein [candidate division KSB1 bacterium]
MSQNKRMKFAGWIILLITLGMCGIFSILYSSDLSNQNQSDLSRKTSKTLFPILMYNSDIGMGYGIKGVVRNYYHANESFDTILFGSSKGEQWYKLAFSIPDFELRQGTAYPCAVDVTLEFNKRLKSNFFGRGNNSADNEWQFPKEYVRMQLVGSRAFTEQMIGEIGLVLTHTTVYDYDQNLLLASTNVVGKGEFATSCLRAQFRRDSRDSRIHPHRGWTCSLTTSIASKAIASDFEFQRYQVELTGYRQIGSSNHILAGRLWLQQQYGDAPYYDQCIIGGGWTARGFKENRFFDHAACLTSFEYRFPIYSRLGGVLFVDSGRVFHGLQAASLNNWKMDFGGGLRYYLDNFIVRFDVGTSNEGTRMFFNFGHVF